MRTLSVFIASSLDGYIAGLNEEIDWLFTDGDFGYESYMASVDTVLMGYKTYALTKTFGDFPYKGKECIVFTRTHGGEQSEEVTFYSDDIVGFVSSLKAKPGKTIYLVGGGEIIAQVRDTDLIDEYIIAVHPILLGNGIALFPPGRYRQALRLIGSQTFPNGLVMLSYKRDR